MLPSGAYTGNYTNTLYGKIRLSKEQDHLIIHFLTKPDLTAKLEYMDNGEWLLRYNNILYGIFQVKFDIKNGSGKLLTTRENPFVEYDPYVFIKTEIQKH